MVNGMVAVLLEFDVIPDKDLTKKFAHNPSVGAHSRTKRIRWESHFHTDEVGSEHTPCADMVVRIHRVMNNK